jgi:hypothetical protein
LREECARTDERPFFGTFGRKIGRTVNMHIDAASRSVYNHDSRKSKIHEQYLNLSSRFKTVIILRKYDPQVTEDVARDLYGHSSSYALVQVPPGR